MVNKNDLILLRALMINAAKQMDSSINERICSDAYSFAERIIGIDNVINDEENDYLLMCRTALDINNTAADNESDIPESLKEIVEEENKLIKSGVISDIADENSPTSVWLKLVATVGAGAIVSDRNIDELELELFRKRLSSYLQYIFANLKKIDFGSAFNIDMIVTDNDGSQREEKIRADDNIIRDNETLSGLMDELNSLIGLDNIKAEVHSLICLIKVQKIREQRGLKRIPVSLHMVFSGNPGTGKTTVARLLAKIYKELGVLSKGKFVETDRSGLVGGYVGQTALKTQDVINEAIGGILFIDEAYSLVSSKSDNDYGKEAIDTIVKAMEDNRDDLIVIVAGYPELMEEFISSNPGLRSRFNKYLCFRDYVPNELCSIFRKMCESNGYELSSGAERAMSEYFENLYENRDANFGNGRDVRNKFEKVVTAQAVRLSGRTEISDNDLITITESDILN